MDNLLRTIKQTKVQIVIIVILTSLAYSNSLGNGLVWDDHLFLEQWSDIQSFDGLENILKGSAPPGQDKIFRPVRGVVYYINYSLWGVNSFGYHLQALLIHLTVTILVYLIARGIVRSYWLVVHSKNGKSINHELQAKRTINYLPFMAGLLFGLHPIHTETINYISASMETWGTLFFFLSFYLYILASSKFKVQSSKLFYAGSVISALLGFFTYEMTLTLPFLIVLYDFCFNRGKFDTSRVKNSVVLWSPYLIGVLVFIGIRTATLGLISRTDYLGYSFYLTQLVMVKVFVRYILLLIAPFNQTAIHNLVGDFPSSMLPYDSLDPILNQNIFDADILISIAIILILLIYSVKYIKRQSFISYCILWFFISLLPVSYIIPHGGAMAEKYLYIASFGFVLLISFLITSLYQYKILKIPVLLGLIIIISCYFILTLFRNPVWKSDITLFSDVVKKSPGNLMASYTLGIWYSKNNQFRDAEFHYRQALDKAPHFFEARFNLANIYIKKRTYDKAVQEFNSLLSSYPDVQAAKNALANIDRLKENNNSVVTNERVLVYKKNPSGFSFLFPVLWSVSEEDEKEILTDPQNSMKVEVSLKEETDLLEDSLPDHKFINQGKALVPGYEEAKVKVWENSKKQQVFQFFLHKEGKIIYILVNPVIPSIMGEFDSILGSVKIE